MKRNKNLFSDKRTLPNKHTGGIFCEINKRTGPNKHTGEKNFMLFHQKSQRIPKKFAFRIVANC